jgi:hypothetical protein
VLRWFDEGLLQALALLIAAKPLAHPGSYADVGI